MDDSWTVLGEASDCLALLKHLVFFLWLDVCRLSRATWQRLLVHTIAIKKIRAIINLGNHGEPYNPLGGEL